MMKKRKTYASRLTKEMLVANGIELITEDGVVIKNGKQVIPFKDKQGYLMLTLYELDKDGNKIKIPMTRTFRGCKKPTNTYIYKVMIVGLHRAMWAWFYGVVEEGCIVDHKSNKHTSIEDYHISNLQLISPRENVTKDREASIKELKCKLDRPLSYYEDKLAYYEDLYQKAVKEGNQEEAHKQRGNTYTQRAKIRYWLSHKEEAEALIAKKRAYLETKLSHKKEVEALRAKKQEAEALKAKKQEALRAKKKAYLETKIDSDVYHARAKVVKLLKENISKRRAEYNNALETNGSKHETTLSLKAKWKRARKELNDFEWAAFGSDKSHLPELINIYIKRALSNL